MTEVELKQAKETYKMQLEGQRMLLESVASKAVSTFTKQYYSNLSEESIMSISKDDILRNAFLSTFANTKESSNLFVYLNDILRTDANISDGQPELVSINWEEPKENVEPGLNIYSLFCNLETNMPILIDFNNRHKFLKNVYSIILPNATINETYRYSSTSLDKITKGSATEYFNRLQLYYFKQLLETTRDEAVTRIKKLTTEELEDIWLK